MAPRIRTAHVQKCGDGGGKKNQDKTALKAAPQQAPKAKAAKVAKTLSVAANNINVNLPKKSNSTPLVKTTTSSSTSVRARLLQMSYFDAAVTQWQSPAMQQAKARGRKAEFDQQLLALKLKKKTKKKYS